MTDNMKLWNNVCKTDPERTKSFNRGGGFKGTAINPTYQIQKATEQFGPVGIGFGWEVIHEEMLVGHQISEGCNELTHTLLVKLWYIIDGKRGEITQYGATTYVGKNKYGMFTDEEVKKKSLTDGIGKCFAALGFSADIHLGKYDDNKYVNDIKNEFEEKKNQKPVPTLKYDDVIKTISEEKNLQAVKDYFSVAVNGLCYTKGSEEYKKLYADFAARIKELNTESK